MYNLTEEECCADTGATDVMHNDYKAFVSYTKCDNRYATMGDNTRLKIKDTGTAVYSLNGKVVKTRNCLHIPALRGPLYFLRAHRMHPGCGVFLSYKVGSFLFFPTFTLQIDDSHDNLVSYQALGLSYNGPIDYIQPRSNPSPSLFSDHPSTALSSPPSPYHLPMH